jgi:hypothetical protein
MVDITCPWCEEPGRLPLPEFDEPGASFSCPECGTTVEFVEEPAVLDLAA